MAALASNPVPQRDELESQALTWSEQASAIAVVDQASHDRAAEMLLSVKDLRNKAEEHHRPMIEAAHRTHKATIEALKRIDGPLESAERILKSRIGTFQIEQQRLQAERERLAREEAERLKAAETEREIEAAEAAGASIDEVSAIIEQADMRPAPLPIVPVAFERPKGVSTRLVYSAEVFDMRALCRAIGEGKVSPELVAPNASALNRMAAALKGTMQIPGVRVMESASVRAGGR